MHAAVDVIETIARVAAAFGIAFYVSKPIAYFIVPPREKD